MPIVYVYIDLFVDKPWRFLTEPQNISLVNIEEADNELDPWDYARYCNYHKINYAKIFLTTTSNTEIVREGSFQITEYDNDKHVYKGSFNLQFSEGTLKGEFSIY